jgi:hypothetical protein
LILAVEIVSLEKEEEAYNLQLKGISMDTFNKRKGHLVIDL